jgi:hypothetical protein
MKSIIATALLILTIGTIGAADLESAQFINHLMNLPGPGVPVIFEDTVIFTAPSSYRRVGISFAYEGYSKVYWYKKLMVPEDPAIIAAMGKKKNINPNKDSGILFHVQTIPEDIRNLDYRMVIDGIWTPDPLNPLTMKDEAGLTQSRVTLPAGTRPASTFDAPEGSLRFTYNSAPGETITVGGTFNGWDPFMYELKETNPGVYSLDLALPPGTYQYVFFHRGERLLDPHNPNKIYTIQGIAASVARIP